MMRALLARFEAQPATRPIWLTTLADLGLLLVGFFVFLQANGDLDGAALARGLRAGFVADEAAASPMPVDVARVEGFAAGSATTPGLARAIAWTRGAARDPRTTVRIAGDSDGTAADVDPATQSAAILATDRARRVAAALVEAGAARPDQIRIVGDEGRMRRRAVTLTLGFAGERQ